MSNQTRSNRLSDGFKYTWRGFQLIRQPGVRIFVVIPLLINIALFSLGITLLVWGVERAMDAFLPAWLDWLRVILWPIFVAAFLLVVFYGFAVLANLIASPFNGFLAAAVERHLRGFERDEPFSWSTVAREVARTFRAELHKLWYFGHVGRCHVCC